MQTEHDLPKWARDDYGAAPEREDEAHSEASVESEGRPGRCTDGLGLKLFQLVEVATIASAAVLASTNMVLLVTSTRAVRSCILRVYVVCLCLVVGSSELSISSVTEELAILENWFCRGIFYGFVPMLTLAVDEEDIRIRGGQFELIEIAEFYSAIFLFVCGLMYSGMGATCRKQVKELMHIEHKLMNEVSTHPPAASWKQGH
jgi:hypothetical protein